MVSDDSQGVELEKDSDLVELLYDPLSGADEVRKWAERVANLNVIRNRQFHKDP